MKPELLILAGALICAGCASNLKLVRTPPGTSVEVALARRAEMVRVPGPPPTPVSKVRYAAVEPALPQKSRVDQIADAYSRGQFCMKTGADEEAIAAFNEAVKLDPNFVEAWQNLAALYERKGDTKKALEAFRNSKNIARE